VVFNFSDSQSGLDVCGYCSDRAESPRDDSDTRRCSSLASGSPICGDMASRGHTTNYLTIVCPCLSTAYYLLGREHFSSLVRRMILTPDRS
jgi:hypothetical protein